MAGVPFDLAGRSHPRQSTAAAQLIVLGLAVLLGCALGGALLVADRSSWGGARTTSAAVVGRSPTGVIARTASQKVVLHLARVPATGTVLQVQVTKDGRARPLTYRQTPLSAVRSGVLLVVGLTLLVQAYRYVVTRRSPPTSEGPA